VEAKGIYARFEVFTAVKIQVVFWVTTQHHSPEDLNLKSDLCCMEAFIYVSCR
jgi:hypothetical protein